MLPNPFEWFKNEGRVVRKAPISFCSSVLICTFILGGGIYWLVDHLYSAQLQAKDATIKTLETDRDYYKGKSDESKSEPQSSPSQVNTFKKSNTPSLATVSNFILQPQWHLKITGLQYIPTTVIPFREVPPFRLVARVNELDCSFPSKEMFYFGMSTNPIPVQGDSVLTTSDKLKIEFYATLFWDSSRAGMMQMAKSIQSFGYSGQTNLPFSTLPGKPDSFETKTLPVKATNEISISFPEPQRVPFTGNLKIFYEISQ